MLTLLYHDSLPDSYIFCIVSRMDKRYLIAKKYELYTTKDSMLIFCTRIFAVHGALGPSGGGGLFAGQQLMRRT